jgi:hypothetical protein
MSLSKENRECLSAGPDGYSQYILIPLTVIRPVVNYIKARSLFQENTDVFRPFLTHKPQHRYRPAKPNHLAPCAYETRVVMLYLKNRASGKEWMDDPSAVPFILESLFSRHAMG